MTETPTPPPSSSPPGDDRGVGDDRGMAPGDPAGDLLGDLQRLAAADGAVLDSIGRLLDDLAAAAAALPAPDVDTDALWARVETMAWGPH